MAVTTEDTFIVKGTIFLNFQSAFYDLLFVF